MSNCPCVAEWPLQPQFPWQLVSGTSKSRVTPFCIMNYRGDLIQATHLNLFYSSAYKGGDCIQTGLPTPFFMNYTWLVELNRLNSRFDTNQGHRFLKLQQRPKAPVLATYRLMSQSFCSLFTYIRAEVLRLKLNVLE